MRKLLVIVPLLGLLTTGCASLSAKGKAPVDRPALVVPAPPPVPPPRPGGRREAAPKPAAEKPAEPKPVEPPPVEPPPTPTPPAQLRTPQTADTSGAAKTVRTTIDTAQGVLNTVNYKTQS